MDAVQLPLIEELVAIRTTSTPLRATGSFQAPSEGDPDALVLFALLESPKPVEQLQRIAGVDNADELIARLRVRGLILPCSQVPEEDDAGGTRLRTVYEFTSADTRRVKHWLRKSGGRHG